VILFALITSRHKIMNTASKAGPPHTRTEERAPVRGSEFTTLTRAEELAERRCAHGADHAGLEVEEHRAGHLLAARGLVLNYIGAVELSVDRGAQAVASLYVAVT
jgi:hypothetical protein